MSYQDLRSKVIRLAHENPSLRKDLLPLLHGGSSPKTASETRVRPFDRGDWMTYADATKFPDGSDPLFASVEVSANFIATAEGVLMEMGDAADETYFYARNFRSSEEAIGVVEKAVRQLKRGKIPDGFR